MKIPLQEIKTVNEPQRPLTIKNVYQEIKWRLSCFLGFLMSKFKLTRIQSGMFYDAVTGNIVQVDLDQFFLCIRFNGRDYYYNTVTGKFDGTGSRIC